MTSVNGLFLEHASLPSDIPLVAFLPDLPTTQALIIMAASPPPLD